MSHSAAKSDHQKLMDRLIPDPIQGALIGLLATTYDMQPEFFETDFLPSVLGLGAWDDRKWTSRIAMEKSLAYMEAASVLIDGRRYPGRPRSLRVEILPVVPKSGSALHAKVLLLVYERGVRLIVGSANLTEYGYRRNLEVACALTATQQQPGHAPLIRAALSGLEMLLGEFGAEGFRRLLDEAREQLSELASDGAPDDAWFVWGGGEVPLWQEFLDRWPTNEAVHRISIASPFWSDEDATGPLRFLLAELDRRTVLLPGCALQLLTPAFPGTQDRYRPVLPESFGTFDAADWGVEAWAKPVQPFAESAEGGSGDDGAVRRALHAKLVLFEGERVSQAYMGSANFTRRGWGFLEDPRRANIEAGVVIQRTGPGRRSLQSLLPPTVPQAVPLDGAATARLGTPEALVEERPWPVFLQQLLLAPAADSSEQLELKCVCAPERVHGPWSLSLPAESENSAGDLLFQSESADPDGVYHVALSRDALNRLLRKQELLVVWWAASEPCEFPINVDLAARDLLPVSPEAGDPREDHLIAYYQGRITWEDLYPDPGDPPGSDGNSTDPAELMGVDTSRIQSYQIREFVEALAGINAELRAAARASRPSMRMAIRGPVSPIKLAEHIQDAVRADRRSATAAGFQLVELIGCLQVAHSYETASRHAEDWHELLDAAVNQLMGMLDGLRSAFPREFPRAFERYRSELLKHHQNGRRMT